MAVMAFGFGSVVPAQGIIIPIDNLLDIRSFYLDDPDNGVFHICNMYVSKLIGYSEVDVYLAFVAGCCFVAAFRLIDTSHKTKSADDIQVQHAAKKPAKELRRLKTKTTIKITTQEGVV